VAVKVLAEHLALDPVFRKRFEMEAHSISRLNHPNICVLHDVGRQDAIEYLVMEHLEGVTLATRLSAAPLTIQDVLEYGIQIADALSAAHRCGISHRDIKPGNVMLSKNRHKAAGLRLGEAAGCRRSHQRDNGHRNDAARRGPGYVAIHGSGANTR
jgi:serine/threonine protein kinase